jgi:hypothetical protein
MDGQRQKVGENSTAIQAGGDVNIGLQYTDVKEIFYDLFQNNYPTLVKSAADEARKNVDECFAKLERRLIAEKENINVEKFAESNTQFLLNDTIKICARKGTKIDIDSLLDVFTLTLCKDTSPILELISEQVLSVLPRLTKEYIEVMTIIHIVTKVKFDISGIDRIYKKLINVIDLNKQLSQDVGLYLDSIGLVSKTSGQFLPYEVFSNTYPIILNSGESIKEKVKSDYSCVYQVYEYFLSQKLDCLIPTPAGMLVALMYMKKIGLGDFDYNIWIK